MRRSAEWWPGGRAYPLVPALLIVSGFVLDLFISSDLTLTPLYVAAPLLAAPVLSLRATALYGLAAVAAVVFHLPWRMGVSWEEAGLRTGTVVLISLLALVINRLVARRDQRIASAQNVAETVQRAVVPEPPDRAGTLRVAARYRAAQRDTLVGGDLYAVRETPHGVRAVVGDVRGKGLTATEAVAVLLGAFREAAQQEVDLERVATRMEEALIRERRSRDNLDPVEGFTTAVLMEVPDGAPTRLRLINRGHPPPVLLGPGGEARFLTGRQAALPLGLGDLMPGPELMFTADFPSGSHLFLYTDGVSEARDPEGTFFDPVRCLEGHTFPGPTALVDHLVNDVVAHTHGRLKDDMALLDVYHPVPEAETALRHPSTGVRGP